MGRKIGAWVIESPTGNQTPIFLEFFTKALEISVKRSMKRDKSAIFVRFPRKVLLPRTLSHLRNFLGI
jgi:hypothetical protein